jgi:hypothetical protein
MRTSSPSRTVATEVGGRGIQVIDGGLDEIGDLVISEIAARAEHRRRLHRVHVP